MKGGRKAPGVARVVDEGGLDALGGGDGGRGGDDAGGHAGQQVSRRCEGTRFWVGEGILDRVEGEEADPVFADGALCGVESEGWGHVEAACQC